MNAPESTIAFLAGLHPGPLALLLFAVVLIAVEFGFLMGRTRPSPDSASSTLEGIILTLVGLLLGFMFSFAAQRYEVPRDVAVREANAIGTTYLRADFLKEPYASEMRGELARYLDLRIASYRAASSAERSRLGTETDALQRRLWTLCTTAAITEPVNAHTTLLTATMNDVIDRSEEQTRAFATGIPPPIVLLLFVVVAISSWLLGYGLGRIGKRDYAYTLIFAILVSFVTYAIADLSEAQQGLIQTSDAALVDMRATMSTPPSR